MRVNIRKAKIREALALVHHYEREEGNKKAVTRAIENLGLNATEASILRNTFNPFSIPLVDFK